MSAPESGNPIPETGLEYFQDRVSRAQALIADAGYDWLLIGPSADLIYLADYDAHVSERLNLLMIPAEGSPSLVVPTLESPLVGKAGELAAIQTWNDGENPIDLVASVIGDANGKRIAVGNHLWSAFLMRMQAALPGASWEEAVPILREMRMSKDDLEYAKLLEVSRRTDLAWEEFLVSGPISGLTETEAMNRLKEITNAKGIACSGGICASGPNSASPHHHTGDRVILPGDAVIFDWGGTLEHYHSDVTRTTFIGEPTEEFVRVYNIVREANQATLDAVKPGISLQELDRAARKVITDAGYGPAFLHRVGHGLGMEVHEEPYLVEGNELPLQVGMVFSDEPGIYLEGKFGVRIEDSVICLADGGKRLNEATRDLVPMS